MAKKNKKPAPGVVCDYVTPTNEKIASVVEMLYASAYINGVVAPSSDSKELPEIEYAGESMIHWDTQEPVIKRKRSKAKYIKIRIFVDAAGKKWTEDELKLVPQLNHVP